MECSSGLARSNMEYLAARRQAHGSLPPQDQKTYNQLTEQMRFVFDHTPEGPRGGGSLSVPHPGADPDQVAGEDSRNTSRSSRCRRQERATEIYNASRQTSGLPPSWRRSTACADRERRMVLHLNEPSQVRTLPAHAVFPDNARTTLITCGLATSGRNLQR